MRAGLGTILQTLTPEAASVLNQAVVEAGRRGHGQTTSLHVAATLLASPSGLLRQACVRSHPTTSHPLQCRALELCFSVALDRLPSSSASNSSPSTSGGGGSASAAGANGSGGGALEQPPISNALMAALKRAQANQRRGCPEQQQQPLLAVKVELEQLVLSILDDPGVSRVMREASFSSPAVKATIEQSLLASVATTSSSPSPSVSNNSLPLGGGNGGILGGLGFRPTRASHGTSLLPADRNLYVNPRLQQRQQGNGGGDGVGPQRDEAKKVLDVLLRARRRNPILVGDSQPEALMKEVLQSIEKREAGDGRLRNVEVISLEKQLPFDRSQIPRKLQELANSINTRFKNASASVTGVVLDLGDLKWLVEIPGGALGFTSGSSPPHHHQQQAVVEMGRAVVAELAKLLSRFVDGTGGRVWLLGTATTATYLRCQVSHPTMEDDWDLQAIPVAPRGPLPGLFPRPGSNGTMWSSLESLSDQKRFPPIGATTLVARRSPSENADSSRTEMCPVCKDSYEHELAKLVAKEFEKSSSEAKAEPHQPLPPWLQLAKLSNGNSKPTATQLQTKEQELMWKQTTEELLKRWMETCSRLHPCRPATSLETAKLFNSSLLLPQNGQAKLKPVTGSSLLRVGSHGGSTTTKSARVPSPPASPVRTDLALGRAKPLPQQAMEESARKLVDDPVGFTQVRFAGNQERRSASNLDFDSFKRLLRGLTEKVSWQPEAASAVATSVMQCKSGGGSRRGAGVRGDTWLLFFGLDKVGKKKMASALSELVAGCAPVTVRFGSPQQEPDVGFRGKTALDRVVEAVRRDPFSVVVLENVDCADTLVVGNLRRAMERGRLSDSHGREVALGSVIFVLISDTSPEDLDGSLQTLKQSEEKLFAAATSGWRLELVVGAKPGKRCPEWLCEEDPRSAKPRRKTSVEPLGLSLDLNLAVGAEEEAADSSRNSSDLTVEHEQSDNGRLAMHSWPPPPSAAADLARAVDEAVAFKPVDFAELRRKVSDAITRKFKTVVGDESSLCIEQEALDSVVGGVWFGAAPDAGFEEWTERVLVPGFQQVWGRAAADGVAVVRLLLDRDGCTQSGDGGGGGIPGVWLPSSVRVAVDGGCRT